MDPDWLDHQVREQGIICLSTQVRAKAYKNIKRQNSSDFENLRLLQ